MSKRTTWGVALLCLSGLLPYAQAQANCTDQDQPLASPVENVRLSFHHGSSSGHVNADSRVTSIALDLLPQPRVRWPHVMPQRGFDGLGGIVTYEQPDGSGGGASAGKRSGRTGYSAVDGGVARKTGIISREGTQSVRPNTPTPRCCTRVRLCRSETRSWRG